MARGTAGDFETRGLKAIDKPGGDAHACASTASSWGNTLRLRIVVGLLLTAAILAVPDHDVFGSSFTIDSTVDDVDANPGDGSCATAGGECTLRAAVLETNALPGPDTIGLDFATYTLAITGAGEDASATGDLDIADDLTLVGGKIISETTGGALIGPGATIDGGGIDRVLHILGDVTVEISGVVIQNGLAAGAFDPNTFELGDGGGIFSGSGATLTLTKSAVKDNNAALNGGGVINAGTLTMIDAWASGNSAGHAVESAGGAGIANSGKATLIRTTVNVNSSGLSAGGILNAGSLELIESSIENNSAAAFGGGIWSGGTLTVKNNFISGNTVGIDTFPEGAGGGIYNLGTLAITGTTVT
ncbi:MAG: hypothetical protein ACREUU_17970, partial [Gammaproteobacteria bacterium]